MSSRILSNRARHAIIFLASLPLTACTASEEPGEPELGESRAAIGGESERCPDMHAPWICEQLWDEYEEQVVAHVEASDSAVEAYVNGTGTLEEILAFGSQDIIYVHPAGTYHGRDGLETIFTDMKNAVSFIDVPEFAFHRFYYLSATSAALYVEGPFTLRFHGDPTTYASTYRAVVTVRRNANYDPDAPSSSPNSRRWFHTVVQEENTPLVPIP